MEIAKVERVLEAATKFRDSEKVFRAARGSRSGSRSEVDLK